MSYGHIEQTYRNIPCNRPLDLKEGDYVITEVLWDYKAHYRNEVVEVVKVYPHMTECRRSGGQSCYITNNLVLAGKIRKASQNEIRDFKRKVYDKDLFRKEFMLSI